MRNVNLDKAVKASDWISEDTAPDPSPLPRVFGFQILVRPVSVVRKTKGNLLLPDTVADNVERLSTVGRVLGVGPSCFKDPAFEGEGGVAVGDYVAYNKFAGTKVTYMGVKLLILRDVDIVMTVADPRSIDPNYIMGA